MIDQQLIEKNRQKLLEEKKHLEELLSRVAKKYPEDFGSKDDENASEVAAYEANIAEGYDLEKKLDLVEDALSRIEKGTYGICAVGGEELSAARLEVAPEADACVEHQ